MRRRVQIAVLLSAVLCGCSTHRAAEQAPVPDGCSVVGDSARNIVVESSGPAVSDSVGAGELAGTVVDAETGKPLGNTQIAIPASARVTLSDSAGHFRIAMPRGTAKVLVRRIGFGTVNLTVPERADSGLVTVVALRRAPVRLCPVVVTASGR